MVGDVSSALSGHNLLDLAAGSIYFEPAAGASTVPLCYQVVMFLDTTTHSFFTH